MADKHETAYVGMLQAAGLTPADLKAAGLVPVDGEETVLVRDCDVQRLLVEVTEFRAEAARLEAENADLTAEHEAARAVIAALASERDALRMNIHPQKGI